jgi:hypothetical protein
MKFEKVIYLDQFMLENSVVKEMGDAGIKSCKEKAEMMKNELQFYKEFGKDKADLCKSLRTSFEFIKNQDNDEITFVDLVEEGTKIVYDPKGLEIAGNVKEAAEVLENALDQVEGQVEQIEKTLKECTEKLHKANNLNKYPYILKAILMHHKVPTESRYYSFIFDFDGNKWRRYEDEEVIEVSEETVFNEASKYKEDKPLFLIYTKHDFHQTINPPPKNFALSASKLITTGNKQGINCYSSILPYEVKRQVFNDNIKFDTELMDKNCTMICNKSFDLYSKRYKVLMKNKKLPNYSHWNLVAYLENNKCLSHRYVLLDSIIKELTEGTMSLELLEESDTLYEALNTFAKQYSDPPPLKLTGEEIAQVKAQEKELIAYTICKKSQQGIIIKLINKNWTEAMNGIEMYLSNGLYSNDFARRTAEDLMKVLSLRFMSMVSFHLMNNQLNDMLIALKYITRDLTGWIDRDDPHMKHCRRYLDLIFKECGGVMSKEVAKEFETELKSFDVRILEKNKIIPLTTVYSFT